MTDEELRRKIVEILLLAQKPSSAEGSMPFEQFWADQILQAIKAAGYVKLDKRY